MSVVAFLLIFAALMLLVGWAMDMVENAVFGDGGEDEADRLLDQMVADSLIRDPDARERSTDEVSA